LPGDTVDKQLQSFHKQFLASTDVIKATLQVVQDLQQQMQDMKSREIGLSKKLDNILAVQHNMHSRDLNN